MSLTHHIRSANRFELKYFMRHELLSAFIRSLDGYAYTDPHCNGEGDYSIHSVYCDSPGFSLFWEKVEGIKFRRKVRFRRYGDNPDVFLEIKQRINRTLQKRRVSLRVEHVAEAFRSHDLLNHLQHEANPILSEVSFLWNYYRLQPRMAISYRRRAFFAVFEPDLRITFDTRVQYHARDFDVARPFEAGKYVVDPDLVVMEIKFSERVPRWLCKLVNQYGLRAVRLSKYCSAVDREYFQGRLT